MVYILMGVAGSGKTAVGRMIAERIGYAFHDADDFHSAGNIEKMRSGVPLGDGDRGGWLLDLALHVAQWNRSGGAVLACSALKDSYRAILSWNGREETAFIYLKVSPEVARERLRKRTGHFFPPELIEAQFMDLEEPAGAVAVDASGTPERVCGAVIEELVRRGLLKREIADV